MALGYSRAMVWGALGKDGSRVGELRGVAPGNPVNFTVGTLPALEKGPRGRGPAAGELGTGGDALDFGTFL
jgi:hypothetical protein